MILLKLIIAHLIGDFILQPSKWVASKEQKKAGSLWLYLHVAIHALLVLAFTWSLQLALITMSIHFIIDITKLYVQRPQSKHRWFLIDQLLHILSLLLIWYWNEERSIDPLTFITTKNLSFFAATLFLTIPASRIIKAIVSKWSQMISQERNNASLIEAGAFIGMLERLFVLAFMMSDHMAGIGFLLAAKSVFRFGDLRDSDDVKLTEYILIGTLLSFGIAMVTGVLICSLL